MRGKPKILVVAGSLRTGSYNKMLARAAAAMAEAEGAAVTLVDLADYPLPPYNGDDENENGLPDNARKLKKLFIENEGHLIVSPEYNSSISGVLKNVIDWVSRPEDDDPVNLVAFRGKVSAIMSASPGNLGGLRGLVHLRDILGNIFSLVLPEQHCIAKAHEVFDKEGNLSDPAHLEKVNAIAKKLVAVTSRIRE